MYKVLFLCWIKKKKKWYSYKWTIPKASVEILHKHLNSNEINKNANITAECIIQIRLETVSNSNETPMGTEEIVMHYLFFIQKGPLAPFPIQNIKNLSLFLLSLSLSLSLLIAVPWIQYLKHFNTNRPSIIAKVGESSDNCLVFGLINEHPWHLLGDGNSNENNPCSKGRMSSVFNTESLHTMGMWKWPTDCLMQDYGIVKWWTG